MKTVKMPAVNLATLDHDFHYVAHLANNVSLDVESVTKDKHRPFYNVTFSTGETYSYNVEGVNQFRPERNILRLVPVMKKERTWKQIFSNMFAGAKA